MTEEIEKYKQARNKFKEKINLMRKKRYEILEMISKKFDLQQLEKIRKKIG